MVSALWVLENIKGDKSFYNEFDTLLLFSSTLLFKQHHHRTFNGTSYIDEYVLYCDKLTKEYIESIPHAKLLWDDIRLLPQNKFVDKGIFWASSKLEVLRTFKKPCVVIDHDFLSYKRLPIAIQPECLFAHIEKGHGYYPSSYDPFVRSISDLVNRPGTDAINCCFNYFDDPKVANAYAKLSLEVMNRFTELKVPNSKYLIFAEQLILKHFLDYHNINYKTLINGWWVPSEQKWESAEPKTVGYIPLEEVGVHFRHYWMEKKALKEDKNKDDYLKEITILRNIVGGKSKIDFQKSKL